MALPVFGIDVGGTFTDVVMRPPSGGLRTLKVLSTGSWPGQVSEVLAPDRFVDRARAGEPEGFWVGYRVEVGGESRPVVGSSSGTFVLLSGAPLEAGTGYTLRGPEPSPLLGIRHLLGLRLDQRLPPLELRLGTTRGTNALLTRTGVPTVLVTTRGLADLFVIREQDRPHLFELDIRRPPPLFQEVIEVDARVAVGGEVLVPLREDEVLADLRRARERGCSAAAVCLLHGHPHRGQEARVAALARQAGFAQVSVGSEVAPLEKLLPRGETTVLDAYLTPVLQDYLGAVGAALSPSGPALRVMTSGGGLVEAAAFSGKDSLLSGPAGGVVGLAAVARLAGRREVIGLDMGGTSTDVSRHDAGTGPHGDGDGDGPGRLELELVSQKAGVRVYTPSVAVETVAAGGGSICAFDGVKLTVGPASAGADPGPACYGRGGPLTVTDLNLLLGRLVPSRFPFPIDRQAALARLSELAAQVGAGALHGDGDDGASEPLRLAEGLWRIACASMVHAMKAVSTTRGYDPRRHALCPFGAAAGQHACELAAALELSEILAPATAGVLSAHGLTFAELRSQRFSGLHGTLLSSEQCGPLAALVASLGDQAEGELLLQHADPGRLRRLPRVELRYRGMESTLAVSVAAAGPIDAEELRDGYEAAHRAVYGYLHPGREVELHAVHVEVVEVAPPGLGAAARPAAGPVPAARPGAVIPPETQPLFHGGRWHTATVHQRGTLAPGTHLEGPAIICEPTGTLVVDPGWQARVEDEALIVLTRRAGAAPGIAAAAAAAAASEVTDAARADPVELELFSHAFTAIAVQMGLVLGRTATSTNIRERLDYSCALFTAGGDLVVNAPHIPVHLGAMGETVRRIAEAFPVMAPGDAFVTNDPYRGGSHLPDITVVTPVHLDDGAAPRAFVASRAHHADVGGISPGSMPPFSRCLAEEGAVIPPFQLLSGGQLRETELRALLTASPYPPRQIEENLADLRAQLAANQAGVSALVALCRAEGQERVLAYMRHLQEAARQKLLLALARLPRGRRQHTDHLDDGTPIHVSIDVHDGGAVIDFTGSGPELPGNLNANRSIVTACVLYALRCLIGEEIPLNAGVLAPVELVIPEGSLLSPRRRDDPRQTPAVVGGNVETSQRIVDVLLGALGLAAASQGTMNNLTFGDGTFGYYETLCGGAGATPSGPGCPAVHTHMTNTRLTDPEVLERRYPVRLWHLGIRAGSGGDGLHQGGDGARRELELLAPVTVSLLGERRGPYAPFGLAGGQPGARGKNLLWRAGEPRPTELGGKVQLELGPGDRLIIETPGGGGWGPPRP